MSEWKNKREKICKRSRRLDCRNFRYVFETPFDLAKSGHKNGPEELQISALSYGLDFVLLWLSPLSKNYLLYLPSFQIFEVMLTSVIFCNFKNLLIYVIIISFLNSLFLLLYILLFIFLFLNKFVIFSFILNSRNLFECSPFVIVKFRCACQFSEFPKASYKTV